MKNILVAQLENEDGRQFIYGTKELLEDLED